MPSPKKKNKFAHFVPPKIEKSLAYYKRRPAAYWKRQGENMAINLFKYVYETVPAYRQFIRKQGFKGRISTIKDFHKLPLLSKDAYLRSHDYLDLFPNRDVSVATTISATSGSTGEPFFFPRDEDHDRQYEHASEIFLINQFELDKKRTLGIVGFGLGIWIGGIFTYKNFNKIAQKGYDFTLVPVGTNKELYLQSFKKFAPFYDQVILMGYPPFIKDILDSGKEAGIHWSKHNLRILTAAEGYSEEFRNYIVKKSGLKNPLNDIINIYGTVEQGTIAHETSLSNLIRKIANENPKVFLSIFPHATNIPTIGQYYPQSIFFEEVGKKVVATNYGSSIPLIRYEFADLGGVITYDEMMRKLKKSGISIEKEILKYKIFDQILKLPFVYVYARSDLGMVFRGANIYPEEIRSIIDSYPLNRYLTGKATMMKRENKKMDRILEIHVELKKGIRWNPKLKKQITESIILGLRTHNSEYAYLYSTEPSKVIPLIIGWPYQHSKYFNSQGKQRWVKK